MADQIIHLNAPEELQPLMRLVLANPALQAQLASIVETDQFEAEMHAIAAAHSLDLADGAVRQMIKPDPLGLQRWQPAPVAMAQGWPGPGWIPTRAVAVDATVEIDWSWTGSEKPNQPFFEDIVRSATSLPFNRAFRTRTSLEALVAGAKGAETVPLKGLIFHQSRCGSTLLANMLGAVRENIVVAEPPPLDVLLQWVETMPIPYDVKVEAVRALVAALGRRHDPSWQRFFIKLDAWHILSRQLLRDAFPDVPWVFLHRDPVEVMMSHANMAGMHTVRGLLPEALVKIENAQDMPQYEYTAALLARLCEAAIEHSKAGGGMFIDYQQLIPAALLQIPRHFGFDPGTDDLAAMQAVTAVHSKDPSARFSADAHTKQLSASPELRELAQRAMQHLHEQLKLLSPVPAKS